MKEFQNESLREDCEKCQNKEAKQEHGKQISQEYSVNTHSCRKVWLFCMEISNKIIHI